MKLLPTMAATLALVGCAAPRPQITEEQRHQANYHFIACLHANANKIDDNISPATSVALGLRSLCSSQFAIVTAMLTSNLPPYGVKVFHDRYEDEMFMKEVTTAVLIERANRAGEASRQPPSSSKTGNQPRNSIPDAGK